MTDCDKKDFVNQKNIFKYFVKFCKIFYKNQIL